MNGQALICAFSTSIFESITRTGSKSHFLIKQENNFLGFSAFFGAILSYYSVSLLTRRAVLVGGHFLMSVLLLLCGHFITIKRHDYVLGCICGFVMLHQLATGTLMYIYVAEVVTSDSVMGLCLFTMQFGMTLQSMSATLLLNSKLGVEGLFYVLGSGQVVAFIVLFFFLKETKGLSSKQKKNLYKPKIEDKED